MFSADPGFDFSTFADTHPPEPSKRLKKLTTINLTDRYSSQKDTKEVTGQVYRPAKMHLEPPLGRVFNDLNRRYIPPGVPSKTFPNLVGINKNIRTKSANEQTSKPIPSNNAGSGWIIATLYHAWIPLPKDVLYTSHFARWRQLKVTSSYFRSMMKSKSQTSLIVWKIADRFCPRLMRGKSIKGFYQL
jgi:hypothetical protein